MPYFSFITVEQRKTFGNAPWPLLQLFVSFTVCWSRQLGSLKVLDHTPAFRALQKERLRCCFQLHAFNIDPA